MLFTTNSGAASDLDTVYQKPTVCQALGQKANKTAKDPALVCSQSREKDKGKKTNNIIITISKYPLTKRVHRRQGVGRGTEILWLRDVV